MFAPSCHSHSALSPYLSEIFTRKIKTVYKSQLQCAPPSPLATLSERTSSSPRWSLSRRPRVLRAGNLRYWDDLRLTSAFDCRCFPFVPCGLPCLRLLCGTAHFTVAFLALFSAGSRPCAFLSHFFFDGVQKFPNHALSLSACSYQEWRRPECEG